jgi:hypothetical protein
MTALGKIAQGHATFTSDVAQGFFEITHNGFALVGLAVVFAVITLTARPDLRQVGEVKLIGWLQARQVATLGMEVEATPLIAPRPPTPRACPNSRQPWPIGSAASTAWRQNR